MSKAAVYIAAGAVAVALVLTSHPIIGAIIAILILID